MQKHCLKCTEIDRFLAVEILEDLLNEDELKLESLLELARSWDVELIFLTNLLSIALERAQKNALDVSDILDKFYMLPDNSGINLVIDELDERFVDYMLNSTRSNTLNLEDELIEIRQNLGEYKFVQRQ